MLVDLTNTILYITIALIIFKTRMVANADNICNRQAYEMLQFIKPAAERLIRAYEKLSNQSIEVISSPIDNPNNA